MLPHTQILSYLSWVYVLLLSNIVRLWFIFGRDRERDECIKVPGGEASPVLILRVSCRIFGKSLVLCPTAYLWFVIKSREKYLPTTSGGRLLSSKVYVRKQSVSQSVRYFTLKWLRCGVLSPTTSGLLLPRAVVVLPVTGT